MIGYVQLYLYLITIFPTYLFSFRQEAGVTFIIYFSKFVCDVFLHHVRWLRRCGRHGDHQCFACADLHLTTDNQHILNCAIRQLHPNMTHLSPGRGGGRAPSASLPRCPSGCEPAEEEKRRTSDGIYRLSRRRRRKKRFDGAEDERLSQRDGVISETRGFNV